MTELSSPNCLYAMTTNTFLERGTEMNTNVVDLTQQIAARTLAFWAAEEAIRRGPVLRELATARASWAALVKDTYGSPVHPNYTKLLDERSENVQGTVTSRSEKNHGART